MEYYDTTILGMVFMCLVETFKLPYFPYRDQNNCHHITI